MSEGTKIERRLAAVAFADVVGFTRLMGQDDVQTLRSFKALQEELIRPKIAEHRGRLLRVVGDGLFIEFRSAVDAVQWAQDMQRAIAQGPASGNGEKLQLRIGINVEDVIVDDDELHGDGVNIAARIQQLASPGEVVVTATVRDYVWNKLGVVFSDLGERELKNVGRPVRVYRLEPAREPANGSQRVRPHLVWTHRPSIAVLPFRNLGGDPGEAYFGEGITEDIIGALARSRSFFVISRHSTLQYRDRHADVPQIASELGVRYILEGSVRRQTSRLRISSELIDANHNRTIWAEKYEGANDDIFAFQDRIASSIVATIEPRMFEAEAERVRSKPTENLDAYDCVLRAFSVFYRFTDQDFDAAGRYLDRAIELDSGYAQAYAYKAWWYVMLIGEARSKDLASDAARAEMAAQRAMALDPSDPYVLAVAAHVAAFLHNRLDDAMELFERSLQLNPNSAFAWGMSAVTCSYLGQPEEALERLRNVWRLTPFDPLNFFYWNAAAFAEFIAGRYDQAIVWMNKSRRENPRFQPCLRALAACLALAGRQEEAQIAARDLLVLDPGFHIAEFAKWYPLRRPEDLERYVAGLRAAGLPE